MQFYFQKILLVTEYALKWIYVTFLNVLRREFYYTYLMCLQGNSALFRPFKCISFDFSDADECC